MISRISGIIEQYSDNSLTIGVDGISYEVYIPTAVLKSIVEKIAASGIHFLQSA